MTESRGGSGNFAEDREGASGAGRIEAGRKNGQLRVLNFLLPDIINVKRITDCLAEGQLLYQHWGGAILCI